MPTPSSGVLNVASVASRSLIYGPGARYVIWLQGCALRCPGCWNHEMWDFEPRRLVSGTQLAEAILVEPGLEGLTILGGEPMHQAEALLPLLSAVRFAGLSVMIFTGFELDELTSPAQRAVVEGTDLLITGRYVAAERDTALLWRGSRNQVVRRMTPRYASLSIAEANQFEVVIAGDGRVDVRGFPPDWIRGI